MDWKPLDIVILSTFSDHDVDSVHVNAEMAVEADVGSMVAAVNLKHPPFWLSDPEVWFAQVESQSTTHGITAQTTSYNYVAWALSPEFATEVRDLILHPPADQPYDKLKQQLVKHTADTQECRLQQLFHAVELGDRKPMQLLWRMQELHGDKLLQQMGLSFGNCSCNASPRTFEWYWPPQATLYQLKI